MKGVIVLFLLAFGSIASAADSRLPEDSPLKPVKARHFDEVAALPEWSLHNKKVYVLVAGVHFNESWLQAVDSDLAPGFIETIQKNFAVIYQKAIIDGLAKAGFEVVSDHKKADTLVVGSVEDLRIYTVQSKHFVGSTTNNSGSANLLLEFIEGEELKMFFSNSKETRIKGGSLKGSMQGDFERLMKSFVKSASKVLKKM